MDHEHGLYFVTILFCAFVFLTISVYAFFSNKPINFWAGEKISENSVTDVRMYNRSYGIMWMIYGISWLIAAIVGLFFIGLSAIIVVILCAGIIILILINKKIRKHYFKNQNTNISLIAKNLSGL